MRTIDSAVQAILATIGAQETIVGLFYVPSLSLRWTNRSRDIVWNSETWVSGAGVNGFDVSNLSENLEGTVPRAEFRLSSLDGSQQTRFWADQFRGRSIEITGILTSGIGSDDQIAYPTTSWRMDADTDGAGGVVVTLGLSDAQQSIPHRSTQESHCEHEYGPDAGDAGRTSLCPYRGSLATCAQTLSACADHFKDVDQNGSTWVEGVSSGTRHVIPLPYGGAPSGMTDRLVL